MAQCHSDYGTLGPPSQKPQHDVMVIDGRAYRIHKVRVHWFEVGDAEDPDLYAAQPLYDWQQSEMGQWIMARAVTTPEWHRAANVSIYGYQYAVVARLKDVDYTFWALKWGSK